MYWKLGDITFEGLYGPENFDRVVNSSLPLHEYIGSKPSIQRTGDNLEEITLNIQLHDSFCDVESEIAKFREYRSVGNILPLLQGNGTYMGTWVIASIDEKLGHAGPAGQKILARLEVKLLEYFDRNPVKSANDDNKKKALAISQNNPQPSVPKQGTPTICKKCALAANRVDFGIVEAQKKAQTAAADVNKRPSALEQVRKATQDIQKDLQSLESNVQTVQDRINNYTQLKNNINYTKKYLTMAADACARGDVKGVIDGLVNSQNSARTVSGGVLNLTILSAIRRL